MTPEMMNWLEGLADKVTEYVTDKASGKILGMIALDDDGRLFVVASYLDSGDFRDRDNYIVLRRFKYRKAARLAAARLLNDHGPAGVKPVGIAAVM